MKTRPALTAIMILLAAGLTSQLFARGGAGNSAADRAPKMAVPAVSPNAGDIQVRTLSGQSVSLASAFAGKPTMLVFWASWCPDCRRETPKIKEAFAKFSKEGLNVVAVDTAGRDKLEAVKAYIHENGLAYPVYYDAGTSAAKAYGITWIPTILLIDPSGKVVFKAPHVDEASIRELLRKG